MSANDSSPNILEALRSNLRHLPTSEQINLFGAINNHFRLTQSMLHQPQLLPPFNDRINISGAINNHFRLTKSMIANLLPLPPSNNDHIHLINFLRKAMRLFAQTNTFRPHLDNNNNNIDLGRWTNRGLDILRATHLLENTPSTGTNIDVSKWTSKSLRLLRATNLPPFADTPNPQIHISPWMNKGLRLTRVIITPTPPPPAAGEISLAKWTKKGLTLLLLHSFLYPNDEKKIGLSKWTRKGFTLLRATNSDIVLPPPLAPHDDIPGKIGLSRWAAKGLTLLRAAAADVFVPAPAPDAPADVPISDDDKIDLLRFVHWATDLVHVGPDEPSSPSDSESESDSESKSKKEFPPLPFDVGEPVDPDIVFDSGFGFYGASMAGMRMFDKLSQRYGGKYSDEEIRAAAKRFGIDEAERRKLERMLDKEAKNRKVGWFGTQQTANPNGNNNNKHSVNVQNNFDEKDVGAVTELDRDPATQMQRIGKTTKLQWKADDKEGALPYMYLTMVPENKIGIDSPKTVAAVAKDKMSPDDYDFDEELYSDAAIHGKLKTPSPVKDKEKPPPLPPTVPPPAEGKETDPPAEEKEKTPLPPAEGKETDLPVEGKEKPPPAEEKEKPPPAEEKEKPPSPIGDPPAAEKKSVEEKP